MLDRVKAALPNCECVLQTTNVCIDIHSEARPNLAAYYAVYRAVAAERRLTLVDHEPLWAAVLEQGGRDLFIEYAPDGIHPGPLGCEMVVTPNILVACGLDTEALPAAVTDLLPPPDPRPVVAILTTSYCELQYKPQF